MRKTILTFTSLLLLTMALSVAHGQETHAAKAARLLNDSKMKFTKVNDTVWTVPFEGKKLKDFNVVVVADKTYLLMFVTVSNQKSFRSDPQLLKKLLNHNDTLDRVKIGIDDSSDVVVRIDLSIRLVDQQEFIDSLNQTAAAADIVYGSIAPFLNATK